jgi:DNA repair protein RecO (recombination protein O)
MGLETCEGIVIRTYPLGDTSRIVVTYTREHGLLRFVAKGARKTPSRFGFALEPLSRSRFVAYVKPGRDLHLLSQAEAVAPLGSQLGDLERLAHAQAALELVDRLVWGEEPHPELYDLLSAALEAVSRVPLAALPAVLVAFELQTASLLGYRPRLDACAQCGEALSPRRLFSPARGGMLCDRCAAGEPGVVTLSADALASLALLLTRPVGEAGDFLEARRAGELVRAVEQFLRHHFQRFQGLNALGLLRAARELPPSEKTPCLP